MISLLLAIAAARPANPVDFGRQEIRAALHKAGLESRAGDISVAIASGGKPESYHITYTRTGATIEAADATGAMYAEVELAERIRASGARAFAGAPGSGSPYLQDRGLNLFLTQPWNYGCAGTDDNPAFLTD